MLRRFDMTIDVELVKAFVPVLSAAVGAAAALGGSWIQRRKDQNAKRDDFLRARGEECLELLLGLGLELSNATEESLKLMRRSEPSSVGFWRSDYAIKRVLGKEVGRLLMIPTAYFPESKSRIEYLLGLMISGGDLVEAFDDGLRKGETKEFQQKRIDQFEQFESELTEAIGNAVKFLIEELGKRPL